MTTVYVITNKITGKQYVGQTWQPLSYRFSQHARNKSPMGEDIRKYGKENFTIETLEDCEIMTDALRQEKRWIEKLNTKHPNGYNRTDGGESPYKILPPRREPYIPRALRRFREKFHIDLEEIEKIAGIPVEDFKKYETGEVEISAQLMARLAERFYMNIDFLCGITDDWTPRPSNYTLEGMDELL